MTNKKMIQMAIVAGLAFGLVVSIPDIIQYVMVQNAIQDFNHSVQEGIKESEQRALKFKREMAKRKAIQAQKKLKKEADELYKNAACVLVEKTGACSCIDKRTAKSIVMEQSTCKVRARQYSY
ncbi:MAG: hypothetical protein L3J22_11520 [Xanthomonadales bacterium]|nr:hypothetical protein [Xanthomonadales bacterium]